MILSLNDSSMAIVFLVPMEVHLLRREYFNRWYSLKAYYAALSFATMPAMVRILIVCNVEFGKHNYVYSTQQ